MKTFAERLKMAIDKRGISQAEAARKSDISQQAINYIINNNLKSSKLAPKIASALGINPEWLIYGKGKFEETKVYELPIIHSPYMLNKFVTKKLNEDTIEYTVIDKHLGSIAFAYLLNPKNIILCGNKVDLYPQSKYLTVEQDSVSVTEEQGAFSFPIFEWRTRHVAF